MQKRAPDEQRQIIKEWCDRNGCSISNYYQDISISGDDPMRPGFQQLINDSTAGGVDGVIVWDQDRYGRFDLLDDTWHLCASQVSS